MSFSLGDWNAKLGSQETLGVTGKFGLGIRNEAGQRLIEFCQENVLVIANTLFQQHKRRLYTWTSPDGQNWNQMIIFFAAKNGEAIMVNKRTRNAVLGCNLKDYRMISVCFQGKPFNITVIQVYAPTTNAEEPEVERFCEDLQDILELTPKKRCPFHHRGLECKSRKSKVTWINRQVWPWSTK